MLIRTADFELREITQNELEEVLSVYHQCEDFLALGPEPVASMAMVKDDLKMSREHSGAFCGIYQADGKLIGVIDTVPRDFNGEKGISFIALLMIAPPYRKHGLGAKIVAAVENEFKRHSKIIRLGVMVNNPGALSFWERLGYTIYKGPVTHPDKTKILYLQKNLV